MPIEKRIKVYFKVLTLHIAQVALQWKQHLQSSMKSPGNSYINGQTYVSLIVSYVTEKKNMLMLIT